MSNRRKPRGQRVNKPIIPKYELGQEILFINGDKGEDIGYVVSLPEWTNDGYWEMDIDDYEYRKLTVVYNPKKSIWIHKTF